MKRSRFSEKQIIKAIKEYEAGRKVEDICRELGISNVTFYKWNKQYSGMDASHLKELKALKEENARLKRMYAEQGLQITMLKDVLGKKW